MITADGSLKGGTDSKLDMRDHRPRWSPREMGPRAAGRAGGRTWPACILPLPAQTAEGQWSGPHTHRQKHSPGFKLHPPGLGWVPDPR